MREPKKETDNGTDWTQIGVFNGKRPRLSSDDIIAFTGYDRMQRFDRDVSDFIDLMTFPCTLQELFDSLCEFFLVEYVSVDEIPEVMSRTVSGFDKNGVSTCRDLLSMIAEANGCYVRMTPDGYLQFKWFENHRNDFELKRNSIFGFETTNLQQFDGKTWGELWNYTWRQLRLFKWRDFFNKVVPFAISKILAKWDANGDNPKYSVLQPPDGQQPDPLTWDEADLLDWDEFEDYTWDDAEGIEADLFHRGRVVRDIIDGNGVEDLRMIRIPGWG